MECSCIDCSDYGDPVSFAKDSTVIYTGSEIAAKHFGKCDECQRAFVVGEKFELAVYKFEGEYGNNCTCFDCVSMRKAFFCGYIFGTIWDTLMETYNDYPEGFSWSKIAELTPVAQEKLCALIEEEWAEDDTYPDYL